MTTLHPAQKAPVQQPRPFRETEGVSLDSGLNITQSLGNDLCETVQGEHTLRGLNTVNTLPLAVFEPWFSHFFLPLPNTGFSSSNTQTKEVINLFVAGLMRFIQSSSQR